MLSCDHRWEDQCTAGVTHRLSWLSYLHQCLKVVTSEARTCAAMKDAWGQRQKPRAEFIRRAGDQLQVHAPLIQCELLRGSKGSRWVRWRVVGSQIIHCFASKWPLFQLHLCRGRSQRSPEVGAAGLWSAGVKGRVQEKPPRRWRSRVSSVFHVTCFVLVQGCCLLRWPWELKTTLK